MPALSKAQYRLMQAVRSGKAKNIDIPKSVAEDFIKATPKATFRRLKERLKPSKK